MKQWVNGNVIDLIMKCDLRILLLGAVPMFENHPDI